MRRTPPRPRGRPSGGRRCAAPRRRARRRAPSAPGRAGGATPRGRSAARPGAHASRTGRRPRSRSASPRRPPWRIRPSGAARGRGRGRGAGGSGPGCGAPVGNAAGRRRRRLRGCRGPRALCPAVRLRSFVPCVSCRHSAAILGGRRAFRPVADDFARAFANGGTSPTGRAAAEHLREGLRHERHRSLRDHRHRHDGLRAHPEPRPRARCEGDGHRRSPRAEPAVGKDRGRGGRRGLRRPARPPLPGSGRRGRDRDAELHALRRPAGGVRDEQARPRREAAVYDGRRLLSRRRSGREASRHRLGGDGVPVHAAGMAARRGGPRRRHRAPPDGGDPGAPVSRSSRRSATGTASRATREGPWSRSAAISSTS